MYPFLLKGSALYYLCQSKNQGSQTGNIWWLWPEVILLVKYAIQYLWFPFAQEAVSPGHMVADPHCHLQGNIFWEVCYMPCRNQSVTAAELFPPTLPAQVWQWCLHPGKGPEGWLKIRVTFSFWHVKIFYFFFSARLFLNHTSMKNVLNGPFFFFPASFSSIFLLWVVVYNKAFYMIQIWRNPFWHKDLIRPLIFARVNNCHYHEYLNVNLLE